MGCEKSSFYSDRKGEAPLHRPLHLPPFPLRDAAGLGPRSSLEWFSSLLWLKAYKTSDKSFFNFYLRLRVYKRRKLFSENWELNLGSYTVSLHLIKRNPHFAAHSRLGLPKESWHVNGSSLELSPLSGPPGVPGCVSHVPPKVFYWLPSRNSLYFSLLFIGWMINSMILHEFFSFLCRHSLANFFFLIQEDSQYWVMGDCPISATEKARWLLLTTRWGHMGPRCLSPEAGLQSLESSSHVLLLWPNSADMEAAAASVCNEFSTDDMNDIVILFTCFL